MIVVVISIVVFPECFFQSDIYLKSLSNLVSFLSLLFACLAFIVGAMAYKNSILRPKLTLQIIPYLLEDNEVKLHVDENGYVLPVRPNNEWSVILKNIGEVSAQYPMVRMRFTLNGGKYFSENSFQGWEAVSHAYGSGYYEFQWSQNSSSILYPGFSIKLPTIYFSGKYIEGNFSVDFTYIADRVSATNTRIPVKVEVPDYLKHPKRINQN